MRIVLTLALLISLAAGARAESLFHAGVERKYMVYVPPGARGPRPTFLLLHSGGSYNGQIRHRTQFDREAEAYSVITVYPQGVSGHWNDGRLAEDNTLVHSGDDVGFLLALIDRLVAEGLTDPNAVHIAGYSNGGMMAMRLGCEAPGRLRSIAVVGASLPVGLACPGEARPIAALLIWGTQDPYLPLAGGRVKGEGSRGSVLSAEATLSAYSRRNGCTSPETKRLTPPSGAADVTSADVTTYRHCTGAPTVSISLAGGGHGWPGFAYPPLMAERIGPIVLSFSATKAIARFFLSRQVPSSAEWLGGLLAPEPSRRFRPRPPGRETRLR